MRWHADTEAEPPVPAKLTDFIQVSTRAQDIKLPWQDVLVGTYLTGNWFGLVLLPSWIWDPQAAERRISSADQWPLLREGQQWCWHGHPHMHFGFSLWERSRHPNGDLQELYEGGTQMDRVGNTSTCCSVEGACCFLCLLHALSAQFARKPMKPRVSYHKDRLVTRLDGFSSQ